MKHLTLSFGATAALVVSIIGASAGSPALAADSGTNWTQEGFNAQHTGDNPSETTITRSNVSSLVRVFGTPITTGPDPVVAKDNVALAKSTSVLPDKNETPATSARGLSVGGVCQKATRSYPAVD